MNTTAAAPVKFITQIEPYISFFSSYISIFFILFGIIINILSVIIFYRRRKKDRVSAQFLGPLAFVDCMNLSFFTLSFWMNGNLEKVTNGLLRNDRFFGARSDLACQLFLYFWIIGGMTSSWIIVLFSAERALVIWFPLRMQSIVSSSKPRMRSIIVLLIFVSVINLPYFRWVGIRNLEVDTPQRVQCTWKEDLSPPEQILFAATSIVIANGAPCILITVLNLILFVGLKYQKMEAKSNNNSQMKAELRIIKNLMLISVFYTVFTAPYAIVRSMFIYAYIDGFHGYSEQEVGDLGRLTYFTSLLLGLNYSCNAIVYVISLDYYKKDCKRILTCDWSKSMKEAASRNTGSTYSEISIRAPPSVGKMEL